MRATSCTGAGSGTRRRRSACRTPRSCAPRSLPTP